MSVDVHTFFEVAANNGVESVLNPLVYKDDRYQMDFDDLAQKTADPTIKMAFYATHTIPLVGYGRLMI